MRLTKFLSDNSDGFEKFLYAQIHKSKIFLLQKLYRFINCVELVSPHHAARELVHTLKQGQITSLFQKSVRKVRF